MFSLQMTPSNRNDSLKEVKLLKETRHSSQSFKEKQSSKRLASKAIGKGIQLNSKQIAVFADSDINLSRQSPDLRTEKNFHLNGTSDNQKI